MTNIIGRRATDVPGRVGNALGQLTTLNDFVKLKLCSGASIDAYVVPLCVGQLQKRWNRECRANGNQRKETFLPNGTRKRVAALPLELAKTLIGPYVQPAARRVPERAAAAVRRMQEEHAQRDPFLLPADIDDEEMWEIEEEDGEEID